MWRVNKTQSYLYGDVFWRKVTYFGVKGDVFWRKVTYFGVKVTYFGVIDKELIKAPSPYRHIH